MFASDFIFCLLMMYCIVARLERDLANVEALKDLKQELIMQKEVSHILTL